MTMYHNNFDGTKPFSDTCFQANLVAATEQTFTVPGASTQRYRAKFNFTANSNVYVGLNVTATSPGVGLNTETQNLYFRPDEPLYVKGGDEINLISPDAGGAYVGISLLLLPS